MGLFDPSRSMIPVDPNSPEGAGVVAPVAPVGTVGGGRGRAFLDRLSAGRYNFPAQPARLPYRPHVGDALLAGTQGFLQGLSAGQDSKLKREELAFKKSESAADRSLKERALAASTTQAEKSQAAEDAKLQAEIRTNVIRTIRETPGLADFARNTNADVTGLLTRYYSGKTTAEEEQMVTTGLAYAMRDETLPKDLKDSIQIRTVALGPDATPDKIAKMRADTTLEFLNTVGDPIKRLKSTMDDAEKNRKFIDAQISNLEGADLRALAPEMTQAVGRAQQNLIDAASLALKDQADPQGFINDLLNASPEARAHTMATLPTPTGKDGKPDEKILQTFDRAVEEFKRMQDVQNRVVQKLGSRAGVDIPAFSSQVGLPPETKPPVEGELRSLLPPKEGDFTGGGLLTGIANVGSGIVKAETGVDPQKALRGLSGGLKEAARATFGTSSTQIAGNVQRTYDAAFNKNDKSALLHLATNLRLRDPQTGETDDKATPQMRAAALQNLHAKYTAAGREKEFNEYIQRLALGNKYDEFSGMLELIAGPNETPLDVIRKRSVSARTP